MRTRTKLLLIVSIWAIGIGWNVGAFDRRAIALQRYQPRFVTLLRPEVARVACIGFRSFAADLYWIAAVNYFGDNRNRRVAYGELSNYLELVLALDPDFRYAYSFGGVALPWNTGDGWRNVGKAVSILERGVARFPDDWRIRFHLAYLYSGYLKRYKDAADQLAKAAPIPGAPPYLGRLAARMYASSGEFDTALLVTTELMNSTEDKEIRAGLAQRVLEIQTVESISRLDFLVRRFLAEFGRLPAGLVDLVTVGYLASIPAEALGGEFLYDPASGTVKSSVLNDRLRVFEQNEYVVLEGE